MGRFLRHVRLLANAARGTRRLFLGALLIGSLTVGMMGVGVEPAVAQATLVVDDDGFASATDCNALTAAYMTIQDAEDDADPGDTIKVCPGSYAGVFIDVDNLTVVGAQVGVDARTRPFIPDPLTQSIIDDPCGPVQMVSDNVVLDGFTIQGSSTSDPCFLSGIWTNPAAYGNNGGYQIRNNIVQANISGIELDSDCANSSLVQFNLIQNNSITGPGSGNGIQTNFGLCDATIDRNKFSGHTSSSFLVVVPSSNLSFTNNELVPGTPERFAFCCVSTATISGNVSTGSTGNAVVRLFGGDSNITITGNTLFNGVRGILVSDLGAGPNTDVEAHFNCIDGNTAAGMQVDSGGHSGTLDAENNWWGSPNGPTHPDNPGGGGDAIIDPDEVVDFTPYLNECPTQPAGVSPKDLVAGTGTLMTAGDPVVHVNASRNQNTSAVGGRFFIKYPTGEVGGRVTCLTVNLNKAGVGGVVERVKGSPPPGTEVLITVLDMGDPGTLDEANAVHVAGASTACPSTGTTLPIKKGNYVVKADPPPALLSSLSTLIAEFEAAANCSVSLVCSGTGEFVEP